MPQPRRNTVA